MSKNILIELEEQDKLQIETRAAKCVLRLFDVVNGKVDPETLERITDVFKNSIKEELSKEYFKHYTSKMYIDKIEKDIENLKRQIR